MAMKIFKVSIFTLFSFLSLVSLSSCLDIPTIYNELWSVSCEFSGLVSRSRRSIPDEPNLNNPTELFNYLYPLADVKLDDFLQDEQRSSWTHSISTWLEDLVDLWQSECRSQHRREKRDSSSKTDEKENKDAAEEDKSKDEIETKTQQPEKVATNSTLTKLTKKKGKTQKLGGADSGTFFTQYGGDIEYFFPLVGFGIPFDGEITFLGFHGFKGIFPGK